MLLFLRCAAAKAAISKKNEKNSGSEYERLSKKDENVVNTLHKSLETEEWRIRLPLAELFQIEIKRILQLKPIGRKFMELAAVYFSTNHPIGCHHSRN